MSDNFTAHTVAITLADDPSPEVLTVMAFDAFHAIVRAGIHLNPEFHGRILRVNVDKQEREQ